jgi:uncharacterized membrane protein
MAFWDAVVRVLVGAILIWLGIEKGGVFIIAEVVGFILMFTAIINFCPLYLISGISTKGKEQTV